MTGTTRLSRHAGAGLVAAAVAAVLGAAALPAADEPKDDEAARQRLEFLTGKIDPFTFSTEKEPGRPLPRAKEPALRYSNPDRVVVVDGAIFVWLSGDRPAVAASAWIATDGGVHREFASLTDRPLRCVRDGKTVWSPKSAYVAGLPLPEAPAPAATPALRLAQLRRQAERFSATFERKGGKAAEELRLMPQPIYRYTADKGTAEGALFVLAHANDPEVLVVLELTLPPAGKPTWSYTIGRMSSARLRVSLDNKEAWAAEFYWTGPRSPDEPYQEAGLGKYARPDLINPAPGGV
jgi:hypothetical protein